MRIAPRFFASCTFEKVEPFTYIASIASGKRGAAVSAMGCKPFWEYALGEFVIGRAATSSVDFEVSLDEEALKLDGRLEIGRCEEAFNFLAKLWRFFNVVEMLIPIFRRISKQMLVLYSIFGSRDPMFRIFC